MLIGFTGLRGVGKSEAASILVEKGYVRCHAFEGGKVATVAYFRHLGASAEMAKEMVHGMLRDVPSPLLPDGATPRFWMEHLGKFMGTVVGPKWTLGAELRRLKENAPFGRFVIESVVYEADVLRENGGKLVKISRPGHAGPAGLNTDSAVADIKADIEIVNDGTLDDLKRKVLALI